MEEDRVLTYIATSTCTFTSKKSGSIIVKRTIKKKSIQGHSQATQNIKSRLLLRRSYTFTNADTDYSDSEINEHHHDCH